MCSKEAKNSQGVEGSSPQLLHLSRSIRPNTVLMELSDFERIL